MSTTDTNMVTAGGNAGTPHGMLLNRQYSQQSYRSNRGISVESGVGGGAVVMGGRRESGVGMSMGRDSIASDTATATVGIQMQGGTRERGRSSG